MTTLPLVKLTAASSIFSQILSRENGLHERPGATRIGFYASLVFATTSLDSRSEHDHLIPRDKKCDSDSTKRTIAYYESWASQSQCNKFRPSDIDASQWTHINFAFADITGSGQIKPSSNEDVDLYSQTADLKKKNSDLKVYIAVGGFGMDAAKKFSQMSSSESSRSDFIDSAKKFMDEHNFDGIDIDWEYPVARGGSKSDTDNLNKLAKEMKDKFGDDKGISITVPASQQYLSGFGLENLQSHVDMINFMSYDLHGSWDRPLLAQSGTNLTEIDESLKVIRNMGVSMDKVNLGLAYYGYGYELQSSSCAEPGCSASSAIKKGPCGKTDGTLKISEIQDIMDKSGAKPKVDNEAAVAYFSWDQKNWVAYDNNETLQMKTKYAGENCLGGSFVWAIDMEDAKNPDEWLVPEASGTKQTVSLAFLGAFSLCSYLLLSIV
ncbi:chitinase [Aspergillus sclerotialis]|uniref:chitinase n=1 Tax=Aspergillus sclerotialis TaxID=2070753 RepID=A0A3A2ZUC2_9EURO|nr:chitinase [Aspergillus sclerotialis]